MSRSIDRHRLSRYERGLEMLGGDGLNIADFVPWLGTIGKIAGGISQTPTGDQKKQQQQVQLAQMQAEQARKKAEADAAKMKMIVFGTLGVAGLGLAGLLTYLITRKK